MYVFIDDLANFLKIYFSQMYYFYIDLAEIILSKLSLLLDIYCKLWVKKGNLL